MPDGTIFWFATILWEIRWHLTMSWFYISLALQWWSRIEAGENPFVVIGTSLHCLTDKSRRIALLLDLPLPWSLRGWPSRSPICVIPTHWTWQGTDVFLGSATGPGVLRKRGVAALRDHSGLFATQPSILIILNRPWSWWVPGRRSTKGACHRFEKPGADKQTGYFRAGWWPCKKLYYFCDGLVFFIDRDLLMGALI